MTTTDFDLLAHLIAAAPPPPPHLLPPQAELEPAPAKPDPHDFIPPAPEALEGTPGGELLQALSDSAVAQATEWDPDDGDLAPTIAESLGLVARHLAQPDVVAALGDAFDRHVAAIEAGAERYQRARWDHARARADRERQAALAKDMAWRAEWAAAAYQAAKDLHHRLREERQARAHGARR